MYLTIFSRNSININGSVLLAKNVLLFVKSDIMHHSVVYTIMTSLLAGVRRRGPSND